MASRQNKRGKPRNVRPSKKKQVTKPRASTVASTKKKSSGSSQARKTRASKAFKAASRKKAASQKRIGRSNKVTKNTQVRKAGPGTRSRPAEKTVTGKATRTKPKALTGRTAKAAKSVGKKVASRAGAVAAAGYVGVHVGSKIRKEVTSARTKAREKGYLKYGEGKKKKDAQDRKAASKPKRTTNNRTDPKVAASGTKKESFGSAFNRHRKSGAKEFTWNGKRYHTRQKGEMTKEKLASNARKRGAPSTRK